MKFRMNGDSASSLALIAVTSRVFFGTVIDLPGLFCAGWLATLLGALIAFPMILLVSRIRLVQKASPVAGFSERPAGRVLRWALLPFAVYSAFDGAIVARGIAHSASYLSLNDSSMLELLAPILIMCVVCLLCNGNAIGSGARLWRWFLPWLLAIVVLLQVKQFRFTWLAPVLGPGLEPVLTGAIRIASWFCMPALLGLVSEGGEKGDPMHPIRMFFACALISAALMVLRSLMLPSMVDGELNHYFFLMDTLLSNGRANISLQLPMAMLWFVGMLFGLLMDAYLTAAALQAALPKLSGKLLAYISVALIAFFALSGWATREIDLPAAAFAYPAFGLLLIASAATLYPRRTQNS